MAVAEQAVRDHVAHLMREGLRGFIWEAERDVFQELEEKVKTELQTIEDKVVVAHLWRVAMDEYRKNFERSISKLTTKQLREKCMVQFDRAAELKQLLDEQHQENTNLKQQAMASENALSEAKLRADQYVAELRTVIATKEREQNITNALLKLVERVPL